jgi:methionyl aminopeptidase
VVAVETFISTGAKLVHETDDGWTLAARDRSFVAQHEHTLVVREGKAEILTAANGF